VLRLLTLVYVGAPALATFVGLLSIFGYRLGTADHARVRHALAARDAEARGGGLKRDQISGVPLVAAVFPVAALAAVTGPTGGR